MRPYLHAFLTPIPRALRWRSTAVLLLATVVGGACGDGNVGRFLGGNPAVDRWVSDSVRLDGKPEFLFRIQPDVGGALVVPVATVGSQGLQRARFSNRGWRRVDAEYLQAGRQLTLHRAGKPDGQLRMFRGMWQPGAGPLDSLPCPSPVPVARALVTENLPPFALSRPRPPLAHGITIDQAGVAKALENVGTLVAPSSGIPPGQLGRYERRVTLVPTGINGGTTLVVEYNDRTPLPDSLKPYGERPRQFIVVLDKAQYGYRPSYTYATVGSAQALPRLQLLDFLDTNNDGVPELFFGLEDTRRAPWFMTMLRFEYDAWREQFRFVGNRCDS